MKYLTIPEPIVAVNAQTDEPIEQTVSFAEACRMACIGILGAQKMDTLSLIDLRTKLTQAEVGSVVGLTETEWERISEQFRNGSCFGAAYVFGAESHIRAVLGAPDKKG